MHEVIEGVADGFWFRIRYASTHLVARNETLRYEFSTCDLGGVSRKQKMLKGHFTQSHISLVFEDNNKEEILSGKDTVTGPPSGGSCS